MIEKYLINLVDEIAGENSGAIVDILFRKYDVNEFLIAKKMNLTVNQVRNILYKLSSEGLVSFTRKKDKKKGWYIYFWTLDTEKCLRKVESNILIKLSELKQTLYDRENKRYYICKGCNIEVTEEKALEEEFSCSECTEVYELVNNINSVRDIKGRITKKENELKEVRLEIEKEIEKSNKIKQKKKIASDKKPKSSGKKEKISKNKISKKIKKTSITKKSAKSVKKIKKTSITKKSAKSAKKVKKK